MAVDPVSGSHSPTMEAVTRMTFSGRLAATAAAAATLALAGCGEEGEEQAPDGVQQQIDEAQDGVDEAQERIDEGERLLEDPAGEGGDAAQERLNEELDQLQGE